MNFKTLKFYLQYFLLGSSKLSYKITRLLAKNKDLFIDKSTDIVIEGYPRCGNTFAVAAFKYAQQKAGKKVKIARHRHELAQVFLAIEYKIPILILIREPLEAISSLVVREKIAPRVAIKYYIYYYQHIMDVKDKVVIGDFKKVITNYGEIIKEINKKYDKHFEIFEHTPQALKDVKRIIEKMELEDSKNKEIRITHIAYPTIEREKLKKQVKEMIKNNRKLSLLLQEAQYIYKSFLK